MGSEASDFFTQIPAILIVWLCGSAGLLVGVLAYLAVRRNRRAEAALPASLTPRPARQATRPNAGYDPGDLPDLDLLLDTSELAQEMPEPSQFPKQIHEEEMRPMSTSSSSRRGTVPVELVDGTTADAVTVLTVMRDVVDGGLMVQMGDHVFRGLADDPQARQRFMTIMRELAKVVNAPGGKVSPAPPPRATTTPPAPDNAGERLPADEDGRPLDELRENVDHGVARDMAAAPEENAPPPLADGTLPGDLPRFDPEDYPLQSGFSLRNRGKKAPIKPVPELNIAQAIEEYLQYRMRHTAAFDGRNIHVIPAQDGGVQIQVDTTFYETVGDVEDHAVREFLTQTIQEWQERN